MRHLRSAALIVAVVAVVAATTACEPIATPHAPTTPTTSRHSGGTAWCQPGWVCGTCPNGTEWGYLDDPQYTNDPQLSRLFFDTKHPCG
jgi:hypothetical protein